MINIFFDTECTGLVRSKVLGAGDQVAQIGGIITDENFQPIRVFCHFCDNLKAEFHPEAHEVTGLSMLEIRNSLPDVFLPQVMIERLPEFFEEDVTFFGYNTRFDMGMVDDTLRDSGVSVDWGKLVSSHLPNKGHAYVDVMQYYKIGKRYRALSDIMNIESPEFIEFYTSIADIDFDCNALDLLDNVAMHCSYIDSIITYLAWMRDVWKQRVF